MKIFLCFAYDICWVVMWASTYGLGQALYHGTGPALALGLLAVVARGVAGFCEELIQAGDQR